MTTLWMPATCECELVVDTNFELIRFNSKCALHAEMTDAEAFEAIRNAPQPEE